MAASVIKFEVENREDLVFKPKVWVRGGRLSDWASVLPEF